MFYFLQDLRILLTDNRYVVLLTTYLVVFACYILWIILSCTISNFNYIKRLAFFLVLIGAYAFIRSYFYFDDVINESANAFVSIMILLSFVFFIIKIQIREDIIDKNLNDFIDFEINRQDDQTEKDNTSSNEKPSGNLNFAHIKGVLERLNYYPLKDSEKKSMRNLSVLILDAEKGIINKELNARINDGLSELLRIMSKYNV